MLFKIHNRNWHKNIRYCRYCGYDWSNWAKWGFDYTHFRYLKHLSWIMSVCICRSKTKLHASPFFRRWKCCDLMRENTGVAPGFQNWVPTLTASISNPLNSTLPSHLLPKILSFLYASHGPSGSRLGEGSGSPAPEWMYKILRHFK